MQLKSALLLLPTVVPPLVLLVFAWRAWFGGDRQMVSGSRQVLFPGGMIATAISMLLLIGFALESTEHPLYLFWMRGGFWTATAGVALSFCGKGKGRAFAVTASGLIWAVWLMLASTSP